MAKSYADRIAAGMSKYLAANPGASEAEARRYARGHGSTGEHGVTITAAGADIVVSFRDPGKLQQALRAAEKYGGRASVTVVGKDGKAVTAFNNPGHMSGRTLDSIKQIAEDGDGLYGGIAGLSGDHYDFDEAFGGEDGVYEYQLIVH